MFIVRKFELLLIVNVIARLIKSTFIFLKVQRIAQMERNGRVQSKVYGEY
jgi:fatty acid-binding protein DegV